MLFLFYKIGERINMNYFDPKKDDRNFMEQILNPEIVPLEEQLTIIDNLEILRLTEKEGEFLDE
jgi:hypothetical protein